MKKGLKTLAALAFWLAVWALLARWLGAPLLLPAPGAVLTRLVQLVITAGFWKTVGTTLLRILLGVAAGTVLGTVLAGVTCRLPLVDALVSPLLTVIKSTPVASFIVLAIIWIGRDTLPSFIVVLMVLPVVWANVSAGIRGIDPLLLELARVYRFPRSRTLRRITLPTVLPHFLSALRSALGMAWKAGVAAEVLTVPAVSIGKNLMESKLYMETCDMFAWTLVVIGCSLLIEKLLIAALGRLHTGPAEEVAKHD